VLPLHRRLRAWLGAMAITFVFDIEGMTIIVWG
jgi:hypothetical protein